MSDVRVTRSQLRSMRSLVGGVIAGFLLLAVAWGAKLLSDQDRCEAANAFRREDLPAAFDEYSRGLGEEIGAPEKRVDDFRGRFAARLDELFPARDCSLWAVVSGSQQDILSG